MTISNHIIVKNLVLRLRSAAPPELAGVVGILSAALATLAALWAGTTWEKSLWTVCVVAAGVVAVWLILKVQFCYFIADPNDLKKDSVNFNLWIISSATMEAVSFHISPWDSIPGTDDPRYFELGLDAGGVWSPLAKGKRLAGKTLKYGDWRVEFTAGDHGWKQHIRITKRDDRISQFSEVYHDSGYVLLPNKPTE